MNRFKSGAVAVALSVVLCSCGSQPVPPLSHTAEDPAGLGTPQQRIQALQNNTTMPPAFKERLMKHLQEQANGTHEFGLTKKPQ